jgi:hypothetical protein
MSYPDVAALFLGRRKRVHTFSAATSWSASAIRSPASRSGRLKVGHHREPQYRDVPASPAPRRGFVEVAEWLETLARAEKNPPAASPGLESVS